MVRLILSSYPTLDLHGFDREYALFKVQEFINDCYNLKCEYLVIIHGIGSGILRNAVTDYLKKEKRVASAKIDFMNPGCTLVRLQFDK